MPRRNRVTHHRPGRGLSARSKAARNQAKRDHEREEKERSGLSRRRRPVESPLVVCPKGKAGFSREEAARRLHEYAEKDAGSSRAAPVRTYRCPSCDAWHLTSQPWRGPREDRPELGEVG